MKSEIIKFETENELENEKLLFEEPELEFIKFCGADIVTASGDIDTPVIDDPTDIPGGDIDTPIFDDEDGEGGSGSGTGGGGGDTGTPEY